MAPDGGVLMQPEIRNKSLKWVGIYQSPLLLFLLSFLIVAFAQPDWSPFACLLTSSFAIALFWRGLIKQKRPLHRFLCAAAWFAGVQAIQLSWFMNDHYVGVYIYPFLVLLFLGLGVQFGLISLLVSKPADMNLLSMASISGIWAIMEWSRLFLLSGFSWNPLGLALSGTLYGMQMASALGVFGMSFWIFFTNLIALKLITFFFENRSLVACRPLFSFFVAVSLLPYLFGFLQVTFHENRMKNDLTPPLKAVLVQTALAPEEKLPLNEALFVHPLHQWERILALLLSYDKKPLDLIVLPEATVPYGTDFPLYPIKDLEYVFETFFCSTSALSKTTEDMVGNSFLAQALANQFRADVVIGLDAIDFSGDRTSMAAYNAAFLFSPLSKTSQRYEKRVLVPMGEYIPFNWCRSLLKKYGITDSFSAGREAKVFKGLRSLFGVSICYEETYGHLMRESRQKGAGVLINLTNDVWYPHSWLPMVHYLHGRLRSVEGGIPLLRACNTGVTCGVDCLGRALGWLPFDRSDGAAPAEALYLNLPLYNYSTFYVLCGDWLIIGFSSFCFCLMIANNWLKRKKQLIINNLEFSPLRKNKK